MPSTVPHSGVVPLPPGLKVARIRTINLSRLQNGDKKENESLFLAAKNDGFFYLDFRDHDPKIPKVINSIYDLAKEFYDLPQEEKLPYDVDQLSKIKINGWKPMGRNFGGIGGRKDGFETYVYPKDAILNLTNESFPHPPVIDKHLPSLQTFTQFIGQASHLIMSSLSTSLGLPYGRGFEDHHRMICPSPDIVRLLKYHKQPMEERGASHTPHTDLGSLTFLFTKQPGLQILEDGEGDGNGGCSGGCGENSKEWAWVEPKEGHIIVNLGDGMSLLTNGYLHSCLHRVGPLPGRAMEERYSFAYLQRAEGWTRMEGLESRYFEKKGGVDERVVTSQEWILKKFGALRLEENEKVGDREHLLTGRKIAVPV